MNKVQFTCPKCKKGRQPTGSTAHYVFTCPSCGSLLELLGDVDEDVRARASRQLERLGYLGFMTEVVRASLESASTGGDEATEALNRIVEKLSGSDAVAKAVRSARSSDPNEQRQGIQQLQAIDDTVRKMQSSRRLASESHECIECGARARTGMMFSATVRFGKHAQLLDDFDMYVCDKCERCISGAMCD